MRLIASFELAVLYTQFAVFDTDVEHPFNDWTSENVDEGFSWQSRSVSFGSLNQSAQMGIKVYEGESINLSPNTVRAIAVPFQLGSSETVSVESIGTEPNSNTFRLPQGEHTLVFETGFVEKLRGREEYQGRKVILLPTWARLTFLLGKSTQPKVLRNSIG